ncbi:unnamed protein product [Spodoptera littoralis]|uniref:FLYWCH-type domain-containing protein n=1 Tax=Spodoptera littoralis TaxID=7109 RepID=A0A9P0HX75_SPOLI|nr:unnamed protein product [Spodoptera littoralis]CAH1635565.1 unnamed protein product [Spodoptera littoralis]
MAPSTSAPRVSEKMSQFWSGVIEWKRLTKAGGNKLALLNCTLLAAKRVTDNLNVKAWPKTLQLHLVPKLAFDRIGLIRYLSSRRAVVFVFRNSKVRDELTIAFEKGMVGCVKLSPPPDCDIKMIILFYDNTRKLFFGVIPENQDEVISPIFRKSWKGKRILQIAGSSFNLVNFKVFYENCCGRTYLWYKGFWYRKYKESGATIWWVCYKRSSLKCTGSIITDAGELVKTDPRHTHEKNVWQKAFHGLLS